VSLNADSTIHPLIRLSRHQASEHVHAAHAGEQKIQNDQVVRSVQARLETGNAIGGRLDGVPLAPQASGDEAENAWLIVDHQDPAARRRPRHRRHVDAEQRVDPACPRSARGHSPFGSHNSTAGSEP